MIRTSVRRAGTLISATLLTLNALGALVGVGTAAFAQGPGSNTKIEIPAPTGQGDRRTGRNEGINAATDVRFDQKLDTQVTLSNTFRDETDTTVELGQYFQRKKPVVLVMPFYKCPGICTAMIDGMVKAFANEKQLQYKLGRDFEAVVVSINPRENGDIASQRKREYMAMLGQPGAEKAWHFLTGDEDHIRKLADEIGYQYKYNAKTDDYAHASGIVVLTPQGRVSRYFYGVEYPAQQMRLALTDSGKGRIGSPVEQLILYCYHYDPQKGTYGPAIFRIMQVAGFTTVFLIGSFMVVAFRKDIADAKALKNGGATPAGATGSGDGVEEDKR